MPGAINTFIAGIQTRMPSLRGPKGRSNLCFTRQLGLIFAFLSLVATLALTTCSSGRPKLSYPDPSAHDWPTARANFANKGEAESRLTNTPYTILWTVRTGGVAATEPIVRDGLLFFSGYDRRVEVFDLATGERRFRKRFDGPVLGVLAGDSTFGVLVDQTERRYFTFDLRSAKPQSSFRVYSASAPPRQLTDSTILLVNWQGRVASVTTSGGEIWTTECEGAIKTAPAIAGSVIYAAVGHSIFALNSADGAKLWDHGVSGAIEGAPAIDDRIYFGAADSFVTALEIETGNLAWTVRVGGGVFSTPTVGEKLLYVASNDGYVTALNKSDGKSQWTYNTGAVANLSPTLSGEYLLTTSRQSVVTMLNAANGEKVWSDTTLTAQATSSPLVVGDRIILTDAKRNLICLAPASQSELAAPAE